MQTTQTSAASLDLRPPGTASKKGFSEIVGLSPGRISQLIAAGLPVTAGKRIHIEQGREWMRQNIDPRRRRGDTGDGNAPGFDFSPPLGARGARDVAEAEIARLKADKLSGRLIGRAAVLRVVESRAKFERDALLGWVNRAAPLIAAKVGADLGEVTAILDREVRAHLLSMAETPMEIPA